MKIGIIGGGIIGLCSAYYLRKSGHEVMVLDQGNLADGCSIGNAGMIVPSHIIPLAAPGMISKGIRWMLNSQSPFYVKPRLDVALLKWGYQFYRHATRQHVERAAPALKEISLLSKSLYQQLANELPFDFGFHQRGLLMLYQTKETEHEEKETALFANRQGVEAHILSEQEVQALEPDVKISVRGGIFFPGDAHITPHIFVGQLIQFLRQSGVQFMLNSKVTDFTISNKEIQSVLATTGEFRFDQVILCTGAWSGGVAQKLKLTLPMQAGKGYSFTIPDVEKNIRIPSILLESRVAVTPMGNALRLGGTMEITGLDHTINMQRVKGIVESIPHYYPEMKIPMPEAARVWHGLRPCSPDGLPYIGLSNTIGNLVMATGHSMMGLSLGPATGFLVSEIIAGKPPSVRLSLFDPGRFNR
jgi:D-amino-acid dehydrogenase